MNTEITNERERIKEIINREFEAELDYEFNNPEPSLSKRTTIIKTNHLKARLEHLKGMILYKIKK